MAPAFKLVDQNGKTHQLADYKGKWVVVYFYPKDQTPGCTTAGLLIHRERVCLPQGRRADPGHQRG